MTTHSCNINSLRCNSWTKWPFLLLTIWLLPYSVSAQVIGYQGYITVQNQVFTGNGLFKFAFVNSIGDTTIWSNDGSSVKGSEPNTAVSLPVVQGAYSVLLGDTSLTNMTAFPGTVFTSGDLYLRIWFSDGVHGFQRLTPDQRVAHVPFAVRADSVVNGGSGGTNFWTAATNGIRYLGGNVGIGIENPATTLDVKGDGRIRGELTVGDVTFNNEVNPVVYLYPDRDGYGYIAVTRPDASTAVSITSEIDEAGLVETRGANGSQNVYISSSPTNPNFGWIGLYNDRTELRTELTLHSTGAGVLYLQGPNGAANVELTSLANSPNSGWVGVNDVNGEPTGQLYSGSDGSGVLNLNAPNGNRNVTLSSVEGASDHGWIGVSDELGNSQARMFVNPTDHAGTVAVYGTNGSRNVFISSTSTSGNRGGVWVYNGGNEDRAGLFIDENGRGVMYADRKDFVVDYPKKPGTKIRYSSMEGPEPAIYDRGVVELQNGRAIIQLPDHFLALAAMNTLTVQLTPESLDSKGVGFEIPGNGTILVGELNQGTGSYKVHYQVCARRAGFDDFTPVIQDKEFKAKFSSADTIQRVEGAKPAERAVSTQSRPPKNLPVNAQQRQTGGR